MQIKTVPSTVQCAELGRAKEQWRGSRDPVGDLCCPLQPPNPAPRCRSGSELASDGTGFKSSATY